MNPFAKRFLLLLGGFLLVGTFVFVLTSSAKYKPYGVPDLRRAEWDAIQAEIAEAQRLRELQQAAEAEGKSNNVTPVAAPRVSVDAFEHDFGMLDPGYSATHTFVIKNVGDAPLVLTAGDTSCKCTLSDVSRQLVPPGESAEVSLTWNTGMSREYYRQYAMIQTNDPDQREIELAVSGTIRTLLDFENEELLTNPINPGESIEAETKLYSQTLADFTIEEVICNLPGFAHSIEPMTDEELSEKDATFGWKIRLSSDASIEKGDFSELLRVKVSSAQLPAADLPLVRELSIKGRVLPPISFYGEDLDVRSGLDFGIVTDGAEKVSRVLVQVRGTKLPEKMVVAKVEPPILQTEIEPLTSRPGMFRLTLRIPAGTPQTIFNREQQHGFVEVADADDPTLSSWFPIHGAVLKVE